MHLHTSDGVWTRRSAPKSRAFADYCTLRYAAASTAYRDRSPRCHSENGYRIVNGGSRECFAAERLDVAQPASSYPTYHRVREASYTASWNAKRSLGKIGKGRRRGGAVESVKNMAAQRRLLTCHPTVPVPPSDDGGVGGSGRGRRTRASDLHRHPLHNLTFLHKPLRSLDLRQSSARPAICQWTIPGQDSRAPISPAWRPFGTWAWAHNGAARAGAAAPSSPSSGLARPGVLSVWQQPLDRGV